DRPRQPLRARRVVALTGTFGRAVTRPKSDVEFHLNGIAQCGQIHDRSIGFGRILSNMTVRVRIAALICVLAIFPVHADQKRWWSHVEALANDGMAGRNTGSPEHQKAAAYVATAFQRAGLEPAGVDGYIQLVKFKTRKIVEAQSSLALERDGKTETLTLG